jgi:hypothetical protein
MREFARAWRVETIVCMSMQKAQLLICETRVFPSSSSERSSPDSSENFCSFYIACTEPGTALL